MTASRGRGLRPGGVVRALGRLSLLVGFGFVAGLLIGVLSEEPKLLAGHLRGEGEAIVLTPGEVAEMPDGQVLSKPEVEQVIVERTAAMQTRPDETPDPNLPVVAAEAPVRLADSQEDRPWAIQVGAFTDEDSAARLAEDLATKGYPTELLTASGRAQRWRVRVQPLSGEAKAKEVAARLKRVEQLPTWVLPMEGRAR
jgi:cell division septation protein DedD